MSTEFQICQVHYTQAEKACQGFEDSGWEVVSVAPIAHHGTDYLIAVRRQVEPEPVGDPDDLIPAHVRWPDGAPT